MPFVPQQDGAQGESEQRNKKGLEMAESEESEEAKSDSHGHSRWKCGTQRKPAHRWRLFASPPQSRLESWCCVDPQTSVLGLSMQG